MTALVSLYHTLFTPSLPVALPKNIIRAHRKNQTKRRGTIGPFSRHIKGKHICWDYKTVLPLASQAPSIVSLLIIIVSHDISLRNILMIAFTETFLWYETCLHGETMSSGSTSYWSENKNQLIFTSLNTSSNIQFKLWLSVLK